LIFLGDSMIYYFGSTNSEKIEIVLSILCSIMFSYQRVLNIFLLVLMVLVCLPAD